MTARVWLVAALLIATVIATPTSEAIRGTIEQPVLSATGVTLVIDFGNGTVANTSEQTGSNVLDLTESSHEVEVEWFGDLAYVTAIDGVPSSAGRYWQYWVNGEYASVACNLYEIDDGDVVVWNRTESAYSNDSPEQDGMDLVLGVMIVGSLGGAILTLLYVVTRRR
ncbi:MAG: DUF4430 domain-containing protein [Candidatus Thorarchaeota archaeon]